MWLLRAIILRDCSLWFTFLNASLYLADDIRKINSCVTIGYSGIDGVWLARDAWKIANQPSVTLDYIQDYVCIYLKSVCFNLLSVNLHFRVILLLMC